MTLTCKHKFVQIICSHYSKSMIRIGNSGALLGDRHACPIFEPSDSPANSFGGDIHALFLRPDAVFKLRRTVQLRILHSSLAFSF